MKYLVLRKEGGAWAIAEFAEFSDAANEWLRLVQAGIRAEIVERVPIALSDARQTTHGASKPVVQPAAGASRKPRDNTRAAKIIDLLKTNPGGLSRKQLVEATGMLSVDVGSTLSGFMKRGLVRAVDAPPSERIGLPAVGRATVRVYLWTDDV